MGLAGSLSTAISVGQVVEPDRRRGSISLPLLPKLSHRVAGGVELIDVAGAADPAADVEHIDVAGGVIDRDAGGVGEGAEGAQEGMRGRRQRRVGARLQRGDEVRRLPGRAT